jgi:hypothetical protein
MIFRRLGSACVVTCVVSGIIYYQVTRARELFSSALFGLVPVLYLTYVFILFPYRIEGVPFSISVLTAIPRFIILALITTSLHYLGQIVGHSLRRRHES